MRVKKSLINMFVGAGAQIVMMLLSLWSRRIFIQILSLEYLGINGFFSNILSMLTVAYCGSAAISYALFREIATEDESRIQMIFSVNHLYCWVFNGVILLAGIAVSFLLPYIIQQDVSFSTQFLQIVFILYLVDLCFGVWSGLGGTPGYYDGILKASQRQYICYLIECVVKILMVVGQIILLYTTGNYLLYLLVGIVTKVLYILFTRYQCYKIYPCLKKKIPIPWNYIKEIRLWKEVRNNFIVTISSVVFYGTDNIVITGFFGILATGLYSNYLLFYNYLRSFVERLLGGMGASIGNLMHSDKTETAKCEMMYNIQALCMSFGMFCVVFFGLLCAPAIEVMFGPGLLLEPPVLLVQCCCLFLVIGGMAAPMFRHVLGHYWIDRNYQILASVLNIVLSLLLARWIGLSGVILGTFFGNLLQIQGYFRVLQKLALPKLRLMQWWGDYILWGTATFSCLFLVGFITKDSTYTIVGMLTRIFVAVPILGGAYVLVWLISPNCRCALKYAVSILKRRTSPPVGDVSSHKE